MSIACVTRDRPDSLHRTLSAVRAQDGGVSEIVVSDDSTQPANCAKVERIVNDLGCRYLTGPRRGLYANRNAAACACTGSHVRTMDDDHEFPPGHFEVCAAAIRGRPDAIWVIGEVWPETPGRSSVHWRPGQLDARGYSRPATRGRASWAMSDGASILPRTVFDAGHRMIEDFKFGASYLEWGSRMHWLGYLIYELDSTHVIHHFDPDNRSYSDPEEELAARLFAAVMHSGVYQPYLRNRLVTGVEMIKSMARGRRSGMHAARRALSLYQKRRKAYIQHGGCADAATNDTVARSSSHR